MFDYGHFHFDSKQEHFDKVITYWNPHKTRFWQSVGVDLDFDIGNHWFPSVARTALRGGLAARV
jgi:putrescine aminotransferase